MTRRLLAFFAVALTVVAGCGSGTDRGDAVAGMVDEVIVPGLTAAAAANAELAAAAQALCTAPDQTTLDAARTAWGEAVTSWNTTQAAWEGPVKMDRIDTLVHYPAVDVDAIEQLLADHRAGEAIDAGSLASVVRGLGTAEYLLFGAEDPSGVTGPGRCDLLLAVTDGAAAGTADAAVAWGDGWHGGAPYADTLAGRGDDAMEPNAALAELVRGIDAILSEVTVQELGLALGITREDPLSEALDEGPAGAAGQVLAARIAGIEALYDPPGETPGLSDLVADQSPNVDDAVRTQLDTALGTLESLGSPLVPALDASPDQASALYDSLVELRRTFQTDVASLLDITVGFSDTDGDSG